MIRENRCTINIGGTIEQSVSEELEDYNTKNTNLISFETEIDYFLNFTHLHRV